jgi:hypothetical protein
MIDKPKYPVSNEDRHLVCQEEVDGPLQMIFQEATRHGWGTLETISAMEEVLRNLRIAYAHAHDDPKDSNEETAFIHERAGKENP